MSKIAAETRAIQCLAWLAQNEELMPIFLGSTGASIDDLKARAGDADFLGSVLDFLMMDDAWVVDVCDAHGWAYPELAAARAQLPGGEAVHWT